LSLPVGIPYVILFCILKVLFYQLQNNGLYWRFKTSTHS
jgi:hypothetical protein